jgi:hypothetical protein
MNVPTGDIVAVLLEKGFVRDDSQPYGYVGYRSGNGEWLVVDDSFTWQDTDQVIQDCVANECYTGAAAIKALAEERSRRAKT